MKMANEDVYYTKAYENLKITIDFRFNQKVDFTKYLIFPYACQRNFIEIEH